MKEKSFLPGTFYAENGYIKKNPAKPCPPSEKGKIETDIEFIVHKERTEEGGLKWYTV